jgi:hypothetical protein
MEPMKVSEPAIAIPEDIAAKCDGPDQFKRFDNLFRAVIATPKADIDKADAKWKRKQEKKRAKKSS